MARLVVGGALLFLVVEGFLALGAEHARGRRRASKSTCSILFLPCARGDERRLVAEVPQVGAAHADHVAGDAFQVDVVGQRLVARVDLEDRQPALPGRPIDGDVPVEAAGAQQRGVEHVRPVGGGHAR